MKDVLELNNSASLSGVCSREARAESVTDVQSNSHRLSKFEVAVDKVRQVWVFQIHIELILLTPFGFVVHKIVALFLVVNTGIAQNVAIDCAAIKSSEIPVTENWSCLCHRFNQYKLRDIIIKVLVDNFLKIVYITLFKGRIEIKL